MLWRELPLPRACTVCQHPDRDAIDTALRNGVSLRTVASRFAVGLHAAHRHARGHVATAETAQPVRPPAVTAPSAPIEPPTPDGPPPRRSSAALTLPQRREKQRAFLQALRETGNKLQAAQTAGVDPVTPLRWAARNPQFAEKVALAQARGDEVQLARLEVHLTDRALAGPTDQQSAILLMFRVKRLDPRYRENASVNVLAAGPVAITMGPAPEAGPLPVGGGAGPAQATRALSNGIA